MSSAPSARQYLFSSFFLMSAGWGGLTLLIFVFQLPPLVWARWGFFVLWFTALSGTALPVVYFLNLRFPSDPPAAPSSIVRQSLWVGVYGSIVAWLQLGHVVALWMWVGLASGWIVIEFIPKEDIIGTPLIVYWSWSPDIPVSKLSARLASIRFGRLGSLIR